MIDVFEPVVEMLFLLRAPHPSSQPPPGLQVAGRSVPRDGETVDHEFAGRIKQAAEKAAANTDSPVPKPVYETPAKVDGGEISLEVHDALKAFCEEQLGGARLKRYLREQCNVTLSDEQSNLITRQDTSGCRALQPLLMAFAPPRPLRQQFTKQDDMKIADKRRAHFEATR